MNLLQRLGIESADEDLQPGDIPPEYQEAWTAARGAPWWHGHALRSAFIAGVMWAKEQKR